MAEIVEITLGDRKFGITRLTIGQLIEVNAIMMTGLPSVKTSGIDLLAQKVGIIAPPAAAQEPDAGDEFRATGDKMIRTISAALAAVAPEMTPDAIRALPIDMPELRTAFTIVLEHAGMVVAPSGEAPGSL